MPNADANKRKWTFKHQHCDHVNGICPVADLTPEQWEKAKAYASAARHALRGLDELFNDKSRD